MNRAPRNPGVDALLDQTEWWFGSDSFPYRVTHMDTEHIRNLLAYLRRHANQYLTRRRYLDLDAFGAEDQEALLARWSRELDGRSALDWLNERPLLRALEAELRRRDSIDGEVVPNEPTLPRTLGPSVE